MNNRPDNKENISVRFILATDFSNKVTMISVNRFVPLINYKRLIENQYKVDLYGRRLVFKAEIHPGVKKNI